jgi:hypothetical protein
MRRDGRQEVGLTDSLAEEAEQFLTGRYLDLAFATAQDVPAWVWVSTLAHGNRDDLARSEHWLDQHRGLRPQYDAWGRIVQMLSRQIRETIETVGCSLQEVQRDVLVPTELAILAVPVGPATMYRIVSSALSEIALRSRSEHA